MGEGFHNTRLSQIITVNSLSIFQFCLSVKLTIGEPSWPNRGLSRSGEGQMTQVERSGVEKVQGP